MHGRVTVVMPVYNAIPYLPEAVESILAQTHQDFDFLIIDDGSTDDSWHYINSLNASLLNRKPSATRPV